MRIYVAGPYTAATADGVEDNVRAAVAVAAGLIRRGHNPFLPHLSHFIHQRHPYPYETWIRLDLEWLHQCDAFLLIVPSPGASLEMDRAQELGLPIYHCLDEVPDLGFPEQDDEEAAA